MTASYLLTISYYDNAYYVSMWCLQEITKIFVCAFKENIQGTKKKEESNKENEIARSWGVASMPRLLAWAVPHSSWVKYAIRF